MATTIIDVYKTWLDNYKIKYEDHGGYISFDHSGGHFIIANNEDDPQFFSIVMPRILVFSSEKNDKERLRVLEAANQVNREFKVVKVVCDDEDLWITTEMFIASGTNIDEYTERLLYVIIQAARKLYQLLEG